MWAAGRGTSQVDITVRRLYYGSVVEDLLFFASFPEHVGIAACVAERFLARGSVLSLAVRRDCWVQQLVVTVAAAVVAVAVAAGVIAWLQWAGAVARPRSSRPSRSLLRRGGGGSFLSSRSPNRRGSLPMAVYFRRLLSLLWLRGRNPWG